MKKLILFLTIALLCYACGESYMPKPRGYFRISFPEKSYHPLSAKLPYSFDLADYSTIQFTHDRKTGDEWVNLVTPANKADVHLTYVRLNGNLNTHIEESRKLAYDHTIKADAINEQLYLDPANNVYGTIYHIEGNAASPLQFYLTDSTQHFLRGAFYIREIPNIDSIQPVIDFLEPDLIHLIETFRWKE
ncbi:gliding motility lipoprotein GldD [Mangrovibacterium marinum]|uniref:Protein involved in gliding motility GldD n=1 Tax=Mangrovibacterium marinum TaxID=1639118 RepID=A0A2T5C4V3_9BACT|nr:gliding motility lipoprotein GldD [Mangrovibacterium marinum]PTN09880.1 protein involved in gliding motility GldD [Mangrovibacterium marinum]